MLYIYIVPWEWRVTADFPGCWFVPGDPLGLVDLRSNTKAAIENDINPGYCLAVYNTPQNIPGARYLGNNFQQQTTAIDRSFISDTLGVTVANGDTAYTFLQMFSDPLLYDATGLIRWKPARGSLTNLPTWFLPGVGDIFAGFKLQVKSRTDLSRDGLAATLAVRWADYRRNVAEGVAIVSLRKWTGYDMLSLYGYMGDDLMPALVPPEYQWHGYAKPETTITESFNTCDSDTLGTDLTWTEVVGDWDNSSNTALDNTACGTDNASARAESALSSANHFAQIIATTLGSGSNIGAVVRFASAANTYYRAVINQGDSKLYLQKMVTGTLTNLTTATETITIPDTIKIQQDSADLIKCFFQWV